MYWDLYEHVSKRSFAPKQETICTYRYASSIEWYRSFWSIETIYQRKRLFSEEKMVGDVGIEPTTRWLRVSCSTNWANHPLALPRQRPRWSERFYNGLFSNCPAFNCKISEKNDDALRKPGNAGPPKIRVRALPVSFSGCMHSGCSSWSLIWESKIGDSWFDSFFYTPAL